MANLIGTDNPETLDGSLGDDAIYALGGDDILNGLGGNDLLHGGTGDDQHNGGTGDDIYFVDSAGDTVNEAEGEGFDIVYALASFALLDSSWIERLSSANHQLTIALTLTGNSRDNDVWGGQGIDTLSGAGGHDHLLGFGGNDMLDGGSGNDRLWGMDGDDQLDGGEGNDELSGGGGTNALAGGAGDDVYFVESTTDTIAEADGAGFDTAYVFDSFTLSDSVRVERLSSVNHLLATALTLTGNSHDNQIWGGVGIDTLNGGGGDDILLAFAGDDRLDGGLGQDLLIGSDGADVFAFTTALGETNVDTISDFVAGSDKIFLDTAIFQGLPPGDLQGRFIIGPDIHFTPSIVYHRSEGRIYYDSNGNAAGGETEFARVTPGMQLQASDFVLTPNSAPVANSDNYSVMKGGGGISTPFKANDTDVDGQALLVWKVGTTPTPTVSVGRGLSSTSVTGVYGALNGGGKTDVWGYTLNNSDPDTIAIAPGTTVTETFYYQVTDGNTGNPFFTQHPNAAFAIGTITIQITAAPSGIAAPAIVATTAPGPGSGGAGIDPGIVFAHEDAPAPALAWVSHLPPAMLHGLDAPGVALV